MTLQTRLQICGRAVSTGWGTQQALKASARPFLRSLRMPQDPNPEGGSSGWKDPSELTTGAGSRVFGSRSSLGSWVGERKTVWEWGTQAPPTGASVGPFLRAPSFPSANLPGRVRSAIPKPAGPPAPFTRAQVWNGASRVNREGGRPQTRVYASGPHTAPAEGFSSISQTTASHSVSRNPQTLLPFSKT